MILATDLHRLTQIFPFADPAKGKRVALRAMRGFLKQIDFGFRVRDDANPELPIRLSSEPGEVNSWVR